MRYDKTRGNPKYQQHHYAPRGGRGGYYEGRGGYGYQKRDGGAQQAE